MRQICVACAYIYDEAAGDPDGGIPPGTRFEDIPEDWVCPVCGVRKSDFVLQDVAMRAASMTPKAPSTHCEALRKRPSARGIVIVGAGTAGWQVARAIRRRNSELGITIVTSCDGTPYNKPMLSVSYKHGLPPKAFTTATAQSESDELGVNLLPRAVAVRIDRYRQVLITTRGELAYSSLVLAHGAEPRLPSGLSEQDCWRINHLDHYRRLRSALDRGPQSILIVGAGLIGCELANDFAIGGHAVALVDQHLHPLWAQGASEKQASDLLNSWTQLPIQFLPRRQVLHISPAGTRRKVELTSGEILTVDQIVVCAGLHVPSRLAVSAGLDWENGVRVTGEACRSSVANIYALGDCAAVDGHWQGFIEPISRQAEAIAGDITGLERQPYELRPVVRRVKTSSHPLEIA